MDFDNQKVYGDTSITDGLVLIINWQKLVAQLKNEESLFGEMAIFFARMLSE